MEDIVIVSAARTAVGKFGGSLAKTAATDLGALAIKEVIANGGKLPCEFWAPPEGTILSAGNPMVIIKSTYAPYMVAFFEAVFQRIWYMTAVASRVDQYLTIVSAALHQSVDDDMIEIIRPSRIHGFGFRSTPTDEAGIKGGLAALLAGLKGTDDAGSVLLARQLMPDIDPATGKYIYAMGSMEEMTIKQNALESQWALQATWKYEF